jgi:D-3-phosphoglycerate dehydrogenase
VKVRAVFVDCTAELDRIIADRNLCVPADVRINLGNPVGEDLVKLLDEAEIAFVEHTVLAPEVLERCRKLKGIVFMGTGAGSYIDLADAARRNLTVLTTPGYGDRAVSEHALALLFSAARNIAGMDRDIRAGIWRPAGGVQLHGLKVAVLGLGGIGSVFADMASALGMRVAGWNRTARPEPTFVADLDEALRDANVVSLHLGLNAQTAGLLDARRIALPARGFILVNTARAALVDEAAMLEGLQTGQIGHVALDVFPEEPLPAGSPYADLQSATLTAHAAYMTDAAYEELWRRTLRAYEMLQRHLGQDFGSTV